MNISLTGNRFPDLLRRFQYPLLLLLVLPPLFFDLGGLSIRLWDESRLVGNTIEMYHNHNYLVTYFDGAPDLWNTKPPLMIWMHLLMVQLFGFNEWSFRISSALFAALTCNQNPEKGSSRYDIAYYIKEEKSIPGDSI